MYPNLILGFPLVCMIATMSVACSGLAQDPSSNLARAPQPTNPSVPTTPIASSTPRPTSTSTFTPTPSPTHTPTSTRTRTPTATRTFTPTPYPVPAGNVTRINTNFRSDSLGLERELIIYLPPGYNVTTQRRYPVLYLLHGWGGFDLKHTTEWEQWGLMNRVQELIVQGKIQPLIVVQPFAFTTSGECSMYFNHGPGTDGKPWGDYIWKDVVNYIDSRYRTLARRESRAIGGFSFGGQGAFSLALIHPEIFRIVGGHSPSFRQADGSINFMNDPNWYNQFDPVVLVKNTDTARQLTLWLDVATGDNKVRDCGEGSEHCVMAFRSLLVSKNIPHEWRGDWSGPHDGSYWQAHLSDYLMWYSAQLAGQ